METLEAAVFLRAARTNSLEPDPKCQPPGRKPGETRERCGSEGRPVVGAHGIGQAEFPKRSFVNGSNELKRGLRQRLTTKQKPTEAVLESERVAVTSVSQSKLPFEVGRPSGIALLGQVQEAVLTDYVSYTSPRNHETLTFEECTDSAAQVPVPWDS